MTWLPALFLVLGLQWGGPARLDALAPPIDDVEDAFARINISGEHLTARVNGLIPRPWYSTSVRNLFGLRNHFQGIQRLPNQEYLVISGSNPKAPMANLFVVRLNPEGEEGTAALVATLGVDPGMWHAGGLSTFGYILAVPIHGGAPRHAKVVFYDFSDPRDPRRLPVEIDRPRRKASATALTRLANGHFLVAVLSAYDGLPRRMDFYLSRSPDFDAGFLPEPVAWPVAEVGARPGQERTFSYFQAINFVRQADGRLYLTGFHNSVATPTFLPGRDYIDLYEVVFPPETVDAALPRLAKPAVIKTANRRMRCTDGYCNLDAAAGLYVDPETLSFSVYAAPGWVDGDRIKVTVYQGGAASARGIQPGPPRRR